MSSATSRRRRHVAIRTEFKTLELPGRKRESRRDKEDEDWKTRPLNVTAARIGDVGLLGVGCELPTEIGMAIKAGSPYQHTFVITHCNGRAGYLPPKHLYKEGGYEITSTGFSPQAEDILVKQALEMLYRLK